MSLVQSQRMLIGQRMAHQMCLANVELLDIHISGIEKVFITYQSLPVINELMKQEFISGSALGDGKLVYILKKDFNCVVPRRTFTKYRELADIPDRSVRQSEYNSGRTESFRFATLIEAYISK